MVGYGIGIAILIVAYYWHRGCGKYGGFLTAETVGLVMVGMAFIVGGLMYM